MSVPISVWEREGFATQPTEYTSNGTERVMRCYSKSFQDQAGNWRGSRKHSNCFWVFQWGSNNGPITNDSSYCDALDVDFLEANLNAALWENTFQYVGIFQMRGGLRYRIGLIGQNTRGTQRVGFAYPEKHSDETDERCWKRTTEYLTHTSSYDFSNPTKSLLQVMLDVSSQPYNVENYLPRVLTLVAEHSVKDSIRYLARGSTHPRH